VRTHEWAEKLDHAKQEIEVELINSREIELTSFEKSPLPPLFQRGGIPPFDKGRSGGIYKGCRDNYETINKQIEREIAVMLVEVTS
jgi:hypothetical protein